MIVSACLQECKRTCVTSNRIRELELCICLMLEWPMNSFWWATVPVSSPVNTMSRKEQECNRLYPVCIALHSTTDHFPFRIHNVRFVSEPTPLSYIAVLSPSNTATLSVLFRPDLLFTCISTLSSSPPLSLLLSLHTLLLSSLPLPPSLWQNTTLSDLVPWEVSLTFTSMALTNKCVGLLSGMMLKWRLDDTG